MYSLPTIKDIYFTVVDLLNTDPKMELWKACKLAKLPNYMFIKKYWINRRDKTYTLKVFIECPACREWIKPNSRCSFRRYHNYDYNYVYMDGLKCNKCGYLIQVSNE